MIYAAVNVGAGHNAIVFSTVSLNGKARPRPSWYKLFISNDNIILGH